MKHSLFIFIIIFNIKLIPRRPILNFLSFHLIFYNINRFSSLHLFHSSILFLNRWQFTYTRGHILLKYLFLIPIRHILLKPAVHFPKNTFINPLPHLPKARIRLIHTILQTKDLISIILYTQLSLLDHPPQLHQRVLILLKVK
jgi:hypothetical protein